MSDERDLRIAVVQSPRGLPAIEGLAAEAAREHSPDLLLLPEGLSAPSPVDGESYERLRALAREHDCVVGGGFPAVRSGTARVTYMLAEPDGATHLHDADQPSPWRASWCAPGDDDGFCSTPLGAIGLANDLEWLRARTAGRFRGFVRLVAGGACAWRGPGRELAREAPGVLARLVGAPAAVSRADGESQIVERDGTVLARLSAEDGEGHAAATVRLAEPVPLDPPREGFWLFPLSPAMHAAWLLRGFEGRLRRARREHAAALPWSSSPSTDLMPYNPPDLPPGERPERRLVTGPYVDGPTPDRTPVP